MDGLARPATSADVARRARVSRATVSYVLNGVPSSRISASTRARVHAAALDLGYTPHALARSLRTGRSNLILLPMPPYPPGQVIDSFMELLQARLRELGYTIILHPERGGLTVKAARTWASLRPVGAIIWTDRLSAEALEVLRRAGTAAFLGVGMQPTELLPSLITEVGQGVGECAARHLVERGHRFIGVVVPREAGIRGLGLERLKGVQRVCREHRVRLRQIELDYDEQQANRLAAAWRRPGAAPTALFTYNDEYAMLLMRAFEDAGVRVPQEVALVGADDLPLCTLLRPRLSSVHLDNQHSAHTIADKLHAMIESRSSEGLGLPISLDEPRMVVRESS
jgi:DNA-binding LacI/PurR family transcriptional regulator